MDEKRRRIRAAWWDGGTSIQELSDLYDVCEDEVAVILAHMIPKGK